MFDYNSDIRRIKQVYSTIVDGIDLAQNIAKIVEHFIPLLDFLKSGETYLIVKMIILMLTEIYIYYLPVLPHLPSVLRTLQEVLELINVVYTLRHNFRTHRRETHLGHDVRSFRPVCTLVPARIGRLPETIFSLCHVIRPSSREGK